MGTYAPAGVALFVASTLALVLIIAPVRSHVRASASDASRTESRSVTIGARGSSNSEHRTWAVRPS